MNLIERFKSYKEQKFRERVLPIFDEYFKGITNTDIIQWQKEKRQELQALEYRMWFEGKQEKIEWFYKEQIITSADYYTMTYRNNMFWRVVDEKSVKLHFPLAGMISEAMANLLFHTKPTIEATTNGKEGSEILTERLDKIYEENKIDELLLRGAELESYSGTIACRPIIDTKFSEYPILKFHPVSEFELVQKYGRVIEIVFNEVYQHKNKKYNLKVHHGYGYIRYKLFDSKGNSVPIDEIPETAELKDLYFVDKNGNQLKLLTAAYKVNRPCDNEFVDSLYGESDYASLLDAFQAIDETYSAIIDRVRKGAIITFLSEDLSVANPVTGDKRKLSEYQIKDIVLPANPDPSLKSTLERSVINIDIQPLYDSLQQMIRNALSRVGLSPNTVIENLGGANASAEALEIREGVSERTRESKARLWEKFLNDTSRIALISYAAQFAEERKEADGNYYTIEDDGGGYEYKCVFPPYKPETWQERLPSLAEALTANLIDRANALKELWKDKYTDDELLKMQENIDGIINVEE